MPDGRPFGRLFSFIQPCPGRDITSAESLNGKKCEWQRTKNNKQKTTNKEQQTTNKKQQTKNKEQKTTNKKQQTRNNEQQTTNKEQKTKNKKTRKKITPPTTIVPRLPILAEGRRTKMTVLI